MKNKTLYFDLDGTMAEWRAAANFSDLLKKGYFRTLAPTEVANYANKLVGNANADVYSLSAYITESFAHDEKNEWMDEYTPNIDHEHRIFVPNGLCKADFVIEALNRPLTKNDVLIDDHTPNLISWEEAGGMAIKWLNGINGIGGTFEGLRTDDLDELHSFIFA